MPPAASVNTTSLSRYALMSTGAGFGSAFAASGTTSTATTHQPDARIDVSLYAPRDGKFTGAVGDRCRVGDRRYLHDRGPDRARWKGRGVPREPQATARQEGRDQDAARRALGRRGP